VLLGHIAYSIS